MEGGLRNPQRVLALWGVPRSASTAFERMMGQRGDFDARHEPFGPPWYFGPEWQCPPQRHYQDLPDQTFASVFAELRATAATQPVFIKDFPHHFVHHLGPENQAEVLAAFDHSFLIRDPAKVLPSMWDKWPDLEVQEAGYAEQHDWFDRVAEHLGRTPVVVDAEDLLDDPHGMTRRWCEAVGIDFKPEALEWEQSERSEHSWFEGGSWHENLEKSTGFARQQRAYVDVASVPELVAMYEFCRPHYDALAAHRLRPAADVAAGNDT